MMYELVISVTVLIANPANADGKMDPVARLHHAIPAATKLECDQIMQARGVELTDVLKLFMERYWIERNPSSRVRKISTSASCMAMPFR